MRRIDGSRIEPLHGVDATRAIERAALAALPPNSLMARAGLSVARLARALAPHARCIWIACGPGNNGGDGLVAATHLHIQSLTFGGTQRIVVTLQEHGIHLPANAAHALKQARAAGVHFTADPPPDADFVIDALLGIGAMRPPIGRMAAQLDHLQRSTASVLCVDLPSGLNADTGVHVRAPAHVAPNGPRHTLSLLTLKPGLFTAAGRDQAGTVWFDDLGIAPQSDQPCSARLYGQALSAHYQLQRAHASHKGSQGEVLILGGQDMTVDGCGMTGAAILAARAALHTGAGRVYTGLLGSTLGSSSPAWDPICPEIMFRGIGSLMQGRLLDQACVVCGCGGGSAIKAVLPATLSRARMLVLDADAINSIAADPQLKAQLKDRGERGLISVLTPHPLEAARLLGCSTEAVMADRLSAARQLSDQLASICVLKGSGSVICAPGSTPLINASGNAALATAGTGDVLAGLIGGALASQPISRDQVGDRVAKAVFQHGWLADQWQTGVQNPSTLTASQLAARSRPME